jgi:hypothetical protein
MDVTESSNSSPPALWACLRSLLTCMFIITSIREPNRSHRGSSEPNIRNLLQHKWCWLRQCEAIEQINPHGLIIIASIYGLVHRHGLNKQYINGVICAYSKPISVTKSKLDSTKTIPSKAEMMLWIESIRCWVLAAQIKRRFYDFVNLKH